ncbi:hypothetical protein [Acidipropionibacterium timonense]|uniref:hypothetical protein n=1 Tax=Acidipropionibacterium timonense TaxID=2161818 RepID=UPI001031C983|nr:hypothetical protein [Acidipropionibacterium timonense]
MTTKTARTASEIEDEIRALRRQARAARRAEAAAEAARLEAALLALGRAVAAQGGATTAEEVDALRDQLTGHPGSQDVPDSAPTYEDEGDQPESEHDAHEEPQWGSEEGQS